MGTKAKPIRTTRPPRVKTTRPPKVAKGIIEQSPCQDNQMYGSYCSKGILDCKSLVGQMYCMRSCAKTCNSCLKPSDLRRQQMRQTTPKPTTTTRRTTTPKTTKLPQWFNRHMKKKEKQKST